MNERAPRDPGSDSVPPARRLAGLELCGERVRLRPHRREDASAAFALLAGADEILRWLVWDGPARAGELEEYYANWQIEGPHGPELRLALEERASGVLAGSLALRFAGHAGQGDVGYWLGLPFQGRGLGREALALVARLAFAHLGAHTLYAWVFVGNQASRRVLEKNGFTLVRTVPGRVVKRGRRVDEWHLVLLSSEWRRLAGTARPSVESVTFEEPRAPAALDAREPPCAPGGRPG